MKIPTLIHDFRTSIIIIAFLWSLFPRAISSRFFPSGVAIRYLWVDPYVLVLILVIAGNAVLFGWSALLESASRNVALAMALGLLVGVGDIFLELYLVRFLRKRVSEKSLNHRGPRRIPGWIGASVSEARLKAKSWEPEVRQHPGSNFRLLDLSLSAVLEECLYRHYLIATALVLTGNMIAAASVACLAYGLIHGYFGIANVVTKILSGALYTAAIIATGSIVAAVLAHLVLNLAAFLSAKRSRLRWESVQPKLETVQER